MANVSIPNLPSVSATTDLDILVIVDSGETTTSKITRADFLSGVGGLLVNGNGADSLTNAGNESKVTSQDGIWLQTSTPLGTGGFVQSLGGVVLGGYGDEKLRSSGSYTTISSSRSADIDAYNSFVGGGIFHNLVGGGYNGVIGGYQHYMGSNTTYNFFGGGENNLINDNKTHSGVIGSKNGRINGSYGFIASSNLNSNKGITSSSNYNTILGGTQDTQIQNVSQQSAIIASANVSITDGRYAVIIGGNGDRIDQEQNGTDTTSVILLGNKESNVGIDKQSISESGVMITNSYNSDIGVIGGNHNIAEATIIGSNNSSIKATTTPSKNVALIACESVNADNKNNLVVLGVNTYTADVDNAVVVPQLVMTEYASLNFADDAAAALGGVVLGGVYHTSGALKVRLV